MSTCARSSGALYLKCEGLNFAGSIKRKAATEMVEAAERDGTLTAGSILVAASSGNLGVALSMLAASTGYRFLRHRRPLQPGYPAADGVALGARVHVVTDPHPVTGFLGARLDYVRALAHQRYVWLDIDG